LNLFVPRYKRYGIPEADTLRREAQVAAAGNYCTERGEPRRVASSRRSRDERFMKYRLKFHDGGRRWIIDGYKRVREDPGLDAWRDTSSLFVRLKSQEASDADPIDRGAGVVHVDLPTFLFEQLPSMKITGTTDPARVTWSLAKFATFFFGSLQRIYAPEARVALEALFKAHPNNVRRESRHRH
jgi:cholesterol oxidase